MSAPTDGIADAIEFAVSWAAAQGASTPASLRGFIRTPVLTKQQRRAVQRTLEADRDLRQRIAEAAPSTISASAREWLDGTDVVEPPPSGRQLNEAIARAATLARQLAAEKTAHSATRAALDNASRNDARIGERDRRIAKLTAAAATDAATIASLHNQLADARAALGAAQHATADAERAVRKLLRHATDQSAAPEREPRHDFAGQPEVADVRPLAQPRTPLAVPGGLRASSPAGVRWILAESDADIVVDGYNVAKTQWPDRELGEQRTVLVNLCAAAATTWGTSMTIVFDGDSTPPTGRPISEMVRVRFSPSGVIADDMIVDVVAALPSHIAVVVVTDDRELQRRVRAKGAAPVATGAFVEALRMR